MEQSDKSNEELLKTISLLNATLDSTADGTLVVDREGKIVSFNKKFAKMWGIPDDILSTHDDGKALEFVLSQLADPDAFIKKVKDLYSQPEAESFDRLVFKDGRIFERYSIPQRLNDQVVGRVWSFRDVTDKEKALADLQARTQELQNTMNLIVGRELKMSELKQEIKKLQKEEQP